MESTSTPPLPLPVSIFYQMLVRNRIRVCRNQWYIPTKYYGEYLHPTPPPPCINILPNAGQEQDKGLEEPVVHTHQILWRVPPPHPSPPPPCINILPNAGQEQDKGLEEPVVHTHQILWRVPPPHSFPSPYQNSTKCWSGTGWGFGGTSGTYPPNFMESTSTPPLPLPVSIFYQMLVRNRIRVWRNQWYIPTKYYGEYLHPTPPPPCIKILPNAGHEQGKGLEEPVVHTYQILWRVPPPHPSPSLYQYSTKCWSGTG